MPPRCRPLAALRTFAVATLLALSVVRPAAAVDFTDLWWNANESGWGVNFVQASDFIFATFFVYDANLQPTWYTGQMSVDANGVWSGPLYRTTGSYFGGAWNVAQKSVTQVGTVTFSPSESFAGTLTYNVNSTSVTKTLTRQTLKTIPIAGAYLGGLVSTVTGCSEPSLNGVYRNPAAFVVTQTTGGALVIDFSINTTGACRLTGQYTQDGQLYRIPSATYTCSSAFAATAVVSQVRAINQGLEGQWVSDIGNGCRESSRYTAALL